MSALGGTSAPGTGAALCRLLRAQGWRKPRKPSPVLPSALFPASLCGNSSNRSLDGGEVGWIFSPLFLEGFYSLDPPCYKLRNLFVISSLNLFLSSHLIIPLLTAFFDSPSPWGQPDRDVPMPNEDTCNPEAQTDPAGWDPRSLAAHSLWLPPRSSIAMASLACPSHGGCSTSPGTPHSWKMKWTLGFRLIHRSSSHQCFQSLRVLFFSFSQR